MDKWEKEKYAEEKAESDKAKRSFSDFLNRTGALFFFVVFVVHCDDLSAFAKAHALDWRLFIEIVFVGMML